MTDTHTQPEQPDIRAYLEPIWSRLWMVLLVVAIATAATYFYFDSRPREYTASTDVFVQTSELDRALFGTEADPDPDRNTANQASFLQSRAVAERVGRQIGFTGELSDLSDRIAVERAEGNDFITISATDSTPLRAAELANAFAAALIELREATSRERVQASITVARRELAQLGRDFASRQARRALQVRIKRLQVIESLPAGRVEQVDRATLPEVPSAPKPRRNAAFALLVSLILACAAAIGLGRLDRRIKRPEDIEDVYSLPMVAAVPHGKTVALDADGKAEIPDRMREAYRTLRTNLELRNLDQPLRTVLVTSALAGEGKSSIVRNLALAFGEAGLRVAVLEADLRRPSLARMFSLQQDQGFTNVLSNQATVKNTLQTVTVADAQVAIAGARSATVKGSRNGSGDGHVAVLTSGSNAPNPPALLTAERVQGVLGQLAEDYDIVLIDSPPILAVSDAIPLLSAVDGALLVARLGLTREDAARRVVELIGRVPGARVLGVVANDVSDRRQTYSYGY